MKSEVGVKFLKTILLGLLVVSCYTGCTQAPEQKDFTIKRGTNISHWLSQSDARGEARKAYFTKDDVKFLAGLGFDHLRIPIDEEQMWDENNEQEAEAFQLLNNALDWCAEYNLRAIVDLHILRSHHFNEGTKPLWTEPAAQERFLQCWRELSAAMIDRPNSMVAYELMNEPVADDHEDWNRLVAKAAAVVRENEPERKLVIGSNRWQGVETFKYLKVPENDKNIILSFHMYHPMALTHYKAGWSQIGGYTGPVQYPGVPVAEEDQKGLPPEVLEAINWQNEEHNRARFVELIQEPLAVAKKYGLPLYCGEWGCLDTAPAKDRLQWFSDVRSVFEENNIAWTTWDYKGGFGIRSSDGKTDYTDLIDVLLK